jgi:hypothetical protein
VNIAWAELARVFGVSVVVAVGLVTLFAVGIRMLSYRRADDGLGAPGRASVATASALFAICGLVGAYGIYLLVEK